MERVIILGELLWKTEKESVRSIDDAQPVSNIPLVTFRDSRRDPERNREINFAFERAYLEAGRVRLAANASECAAHNDGNAGHAVLDFNSKLFESLACELCEILFGALRWEGHFTRILKKVQNFAYEFGMDISVVIMRVSPRICNHMLYNFLKNVAVTIFFFFQ